MADQKISQLSSGAPAQAGDEYVVARSGANYKLTLTNIAANMPATTVASGNLIVSTGNVGIGTASPASRLDVRTSAAEIGRFSSSAANGGYQVFYPDNVTTPVYVGSQKAILSTGNATDFAIVGTGANNMVFGTNSAERMRIDSSGNVGIGGTASAVDRVTVTGTLPTSGNTSIGIGSRGTIPSGTTSQAASYSSVPATQAASFTLGELVHYWALQGTFGAGSTVTNQFGFRVDSSLTGATNNFGFHSNIASGSNRWNFYAAGTAQNYFAGNTLIGTTADLGSGARVNINSASGEADVLAMRYTDAVAGKHWRFQIDSNSTCYFVNQGLTGVYITDGGTSWTSTSDERLKTDLMPIEDSLSKIGQLRSVTGRFKTDEEGTSRSFLIAQDVLAVLPEAVDARNPEKLGVAYTDVIPLLVAAIKELSAKVAALEAK